MLMPRVCRAIPVLFLCLSQWLLCLDLSAADPFMSVREIKPGMKGYGLTVFSGTKIEKFDAEVISVMKQFMVKGDLILIRMSGGPLAESGIVAGMSGSPVYINDRLIGAVAYGWTFAKEPIAGVTPIHEMLEVWGRKGPSVVQTASAGKDEQEAGAGRMGELGEEKIGSVPNYANYEFTMKPILTPLMVSGVSMRLLKDLEPTFARFGLFPVQSGGTAPNYDGPPPDLQPGSAVGVQLVRGDMDMAAIGTVTYRKGDRVLAFGHPMFQGGMIDMPMVEGFVHLTLARQDRSYKLAGTRAVVGRASRDFRPAVAGEMGKEARMIPCLVIVKSEATGQTHQYKYELIHDKLWTPRLIPVTIGDSIATTEAEMGDMMIDISTSIHLKDFLKPVSVKNTFFEQAGFFAGLQDVYMNAARLMANDFRQVSVERIVTEVSIRRARETASIETLRTDRAVAAPGKTVNVIVGLRPYKAKDLTFQTIPLPIPDTLPDQYPLCIIASDARIGEQLARSLSPGAFMPTDFAQVVRLIERGENNKTIVIHAILPDMGLTSRGEALPSLPSSVLNILGGQASGRMDFAQGSLVATAPTPWVLDGIQATTVTIGEEK